MFVTEISRIGEKAFGASLQPSQHLKDAVPFSDSARARRRDGRCAQLMTPRCVSVAIHLARHGSPRQVPHLPRRVERVMEGLETEVLAIGHMVAERVQLA